MRRLTALCAAAGIAMSTFIVISPAQAAPWSLVRYDNTGYCQIWDAGLAFKPLHWPSDYKPIGKPAPTLAAAMSERDVLIKKGKCKETFLGRS
jgi:hypothetical protein